MPCQSNPCIKARRAAADKSAPAAAPGRAGPAPAHRPPPRAAGPGIGDPDPIAYVRKRISPRQRS